MFHPKLAAVGCLALLLAAAWVGRPRADAKSDTEWKTVHSARGLTVFRSPTAPAAYLLSTDQTAVLIDAPLPPGGNLPAKPKLVLLSHHHRDTVAGAAGFVESGVPVRGPKAAAEWLEPAAVAKHWADALPLRSSRTAYFVVPEGIPGLDLTLSDGTEVPLGGGWTLTAVATPGHSRDHLAFAAAHPDERGGPLVFAGDAVTGAGKLWTPFTTDWDHWTDAGLKPAAESLQKLAALKPAALFPARGPIVTAAPGKRLEAAAGAVEEAGFHKSYERYTNRLGNPPEYPFLVNKEQIASGGDKPWSKVAAGLWITGNTYVLASAAPGKPCLVLDPWGQRSVDQIAKLRAAEGLGPVERVVFSHAHYDHFDGVYLLPEKAGFQVWGLDIVAAPLADPFRFRAPFLDARPVAFDKVLADGESVPWREFTFRFHALPGQSAFTCGIETTIAGKRCLFTADNFFHQAQFSGTGGWMGLNRSTPAAYARSAKKVRDLNPEWVLAEHGGPFAFDPEDFRRREKWGDAAGAACDAVCPSGRHEMDWSPHRVSVEPILVKAKAGGTARVLVRTADPGPGSVPLSVTLRGRGVVPDQTVTPAGRAPAELVVRVPAGTKPGRYVLSVSSDTSEGEVADPFLGLDVEP